MLKAVRYAAIGVLALGASSIAPRAAFADSINLLRQATTGLSPSILIDQARRSPDSDDQASASIDEDCVAVSDRSRNPASPLGSVRWNFGQLTWEWDDPAQPSLVYILCVDPKREAAPLSGAGGLGLMAGLSWSAAQPATRANSGATSLPGSVSGERPSITSSPNSAPTTSVGSYPTGHDGGVAGASSDSTPATLPAGELIVMTMNDAVPFGSFTPSGANSGFGGDSGFGAGGSGNQDAPIAPFDPPISLDPGEMAPVPEPGTLLLMGTGLAAMWRSARRRK